MKRFILVGSILLLTMLLAAPTRILAQGPVKIGVLVPLSGMAAQGGVEMRDGIEMAAKEKKTLLGRPIELVVEDTRLKPDVAVSKAEKLVFKDGVVSLIGVFFQRGWIGHCQKHRQTECAFSYDPRHDHRVLRHAPPGVPQRAAS